MKTARSSKKSTSKISFGKLEIILTALIVLTMALLVAIIVVRLTADESNGITSENNRILDIADPDLIRQNLNKQELFPIGIVSNRNDLTTITEKYALKTSEMQKYKTEFYDEFNDTFATNNYLALGYLNEWCGTTTFKYDGQKSHGNQLNISLIYSTSGGPCSIAGDILFIEIPKNITDLGQITYSITKKQSSSSHSTDEVLKPIVYLYPETDTELTVTLGSPDRITVSYPKYQDGWHVLTRPDGTLTDLETDRELYSLYWENTRNYEPDLSNGFIVKGEDSAKFLEEKLALLGLNSKETEEFIVYWLPRLESSPYNLIKFEDLATIEQDMALIISADGQTVNPDTLIRVRMVYEPLSQPIDIVEQELTPAPARQGFTVVEWGGSEV